MTQPIASFNGLASGIQWRDLVDQLMQAETARKLTPLATRQTSLRSAGDAWRQFQSVAAKLREAARTIQNGTTFDTFKTQVTKPGGKELVSVSTSASASPGSYAVEVVSLARAERLAGNVASSSSVALGVAGSFAINGRSITVTADDTLATLRDKINTSQSSLGQAGVTATLLTAGAGARLVLTSQSSGASGIALTDDGTGTLQSLGFTDGTMTANIGLNGAARTNAVSSSTQALAALLGVPLPSPSTIKVGGQSISVDLSVDSLTTIAAKIAAATGNANAVRVQSEQVGAATRYYLESDLPVIAESANATRTLEALGFTRGGRSGVQQVVRAAQGFSDALSGTAAQGSALLSNLTMGGSSLGIAAGDTITIAGTRGDGSAVSTQVTVTGSTTVQDLLNAIGHATTGFGAGARPATVSLADGKIALTDGSAGDSALSLSLVHTTSSGTSRSLGAFSTAAGTVGRDRVIAAGSDAVVRVDGQLVRRSTNTISDAVAGLSINALAAEPGTLTTVQVTRDVEAITKSIGQFAVAYNDLQDWVTKNSAKGGPLEGNTALRSLAQSLSQSLLQPIEGLTGTYATPAIAGFERNKFGVASINADMFQAAFAADPASVRRLFTQSAIASDSAVEFISSTAKSRGSSSGYAINVTQAATKATRSGASFTTYSTTGSPDTMRITDAASKAEIDITLADGDSIDTIIARMNAAFASNSAQLVAEKSVDNRIVLTSKEYGSDGGFTIAYVPGVGGDGTATLGLSAGTASGLDIAGTINGVAATGQGQVLTGATGDASEGIAIRFTGTAPRAAGTLAFSLGLGGMLARVAEDMASEGGAVASARNLATLQADRINPRLDDIQKRLDARRDALIRQFVAMEAALAKSQALSTAISGQISSLYAQSGN